VMTTLGELSNVEINSVVFSADGKELATGDQNGSVFLWYANLPAQLAGITAPSARAGTAYRPGLAGPADNGLHPAQGR
jgi:WD40 repeat protein